MCKKIMNASSIFSRATSLFLSVLLLLSVFFAFSQSNQANAASYATIKDTNVDNGDKQVPIDIQPTITFNGTIKNFHKEKISLGLKQTGDKYKEIAIKEIRKSADKLIIIPEKYLEFNETYKLELEDNAVEIEGKNYYKNKKTIRFETNYIDFYDLMVVNDAKLANILNTYTPRELKVFAPERYIEEITVLHKKRGKVEEDARQQVTDSLTNIDVVIKEDTKINRVFIKIKYDGHTMHSANGKLLEEDTGNNNNKQQTETYTIGFGNLPLAYDLVVTAYNVKNEKLDEQTIKIAADDNLFSEVSEKYDYKTAGLGYTLYDLLANDTDFNDLLTENDMQKLKVQVIP
ncbi:Ig-like domain-containing protein [Bacillus tianshenii]|nr:Ig-like domain-containing protein [Bacillus tianshenii]